MEQKYEVAKKAYNNSYATYSHFQVGACIVLTDGNYIMGTNVENASYGLTNCAERSALFSAYSQGYRKNDIKELIVMSKKGVSPCGACRQVILELMNLDAIVTVCNLEGKIYSMKVNELLPCMFSEADLNE